MENNKFSLPNDVDAEFAVTTGWSMFGCDLDKEIILAVSSSISFFTD